MNDNPNYSYITTFIDLNENTHYFKDAEARDAIDDLEYNKQDKITSTNKLPAANVSGLANVATSGSYADLSNTPTIDTALSDSSENAVQNKAVKKYVDDNISGLGTALNFKGTKATEADVKAITTANAGDVWICTADSSEWICKTDITVATASAWEKFGPIIDLSGYELKENLKALAYKDTASGSYTPAGTVTIDGYTPEGTVSAPTLDVMLNTTQIRPITDVGSLPSHAADVFTQGSYTQGTFSGGTLPQLSVSVVSETLTLSFDRGTLPTHGADAYVQPTFTQGTFNQGALPTQGTATNVATSVQYATASAPTFTGTEKAPTGSFSGTQGTVEVS